MSDQLALGKLTARSALLLNRFVGLGGVPAAINKTAEAAATHKGAAGRPGARRDLKEAPQPRRKASAPTHQAFGIGSNSAGIGKGSIGGGQEFDPGCWVAP